MKMNLLIETVTPRKQQLATPLKHLCPLKELLHQSNFYLHMGEPSQSNSEL